MKKLIIILLICLILSLSCDTTNPIWKGKSANKQKFYKIRRIKNYM